MSYELLRSMYFGEGSNADLVDAAARSRLHIAGDLDRLIPQLLRRGLDVFLTGNPGDGKSHLVMTLRDRGDLTGARVELDLSAAPVHAVVARWEAAASAGEPMIVCANQGPLREFLEAAAEHPQLAGRVRELAAQVGRLAQTSADHFPEPPGSSALIDLADRNVLNLDLVRAALDRVCAREFLPAFGPRAVDSSAGRNLLLFNGAAEAKDRFARLLRHAGRRLGEHVTFRQLWGCLAYAIGGGRTEQRLRAEVSRGGVGAGTYPLDFLCDGRGEGALITAIRDHADPAACPTPALDDEIWSSGQPRRGEWLIDEPEFEPPQVLWERGLEKEALEQFSSLKRLVALAHESGGEVLAALEADAQAPGDLDDEALRDRVLRGIRRCYLTAGAEREAPQWLRHGVPLWVSHSYRDLPMEERAHVAVTGLPPADFRVLRPLHAAWLDRALGPRLEVAWLQHEPSGLRLRVDGVLLAALQLAMSTSGAMEPPERVGRFLSLLSGWLEREGLGAPIGEDRLAVLKTPRTELVATGTVIELESGAARYAP